MTISGIPGDTMGTDFPGDLPRAVGARTFDARVEPVWRDYRRRESRLGFLRRRCIKREICHVVRSINVWLDLTGSAVSGWDRVEGDRACRLEVPVVGLIASFQRYLAQAGGEGLGTWRHLMALRDDRCLLIPGSFRLPFPVSGCRAGPGVSVTSSERVQAELAEVETRLSLEQTIRAATGARAGRALFETVGFQKSQHAIRKELLPHLTYVLLKEIAEASLTMRLPGFIGSPRTLWRDP